jgi:nitric oxide reductase NorQ protein
MYDIKNPTIWFFHTVSELSESGVPRLRMLPGQHVPSPDGLKICDVTLNTESDMAPRKAHPVGTIFASKSVEIKSSSRGTLYYSTKGSSLISMVGGVSADIEVAYEEYKLQSTTDTTTVKEKKKKKKEEEAPKEAGVSLIDRLLKENPIPTVDTDNFHVEHDVWAGLLFNMHQGYNTMLVGDSGTGKTELAMLMGRRMKKNVKVFDMAAKQDPIASLIGVHRFDGKSVFDRADFTYALEEDGIVVLDELPRAPMNTNNILFPVLDTRRELNMDIASHGMRSIKVNPNCRFIATANEGYEYTGNNVLDRALKERFQIIMVNYMPEEQEVKLLMYRTGASNENASIIVKISKTIRDLNRREDVSSSVSIRHSLYAADLSSAGMPVSKAMELAFLPMFHIEDEKKKIKDLLSSR